MSYKYCSAATFPKMKSQASQGHVNCVNWEKQQQQQQKPTTL